MFSQSEENYIKAIYSLSLATQDGISTNVLADKIQTKPSSVTDMLKKLQEKSLIDYVKYKGCVLTPKGKSIALDIIRKHRLWEVFLVNKLKFGWEEVHEIAEQLEHIQSQKLINKLDEFLNFPKFDPHGDPIPDSNGKIPDLFKTCLLSDLKVGDVCTVVGVEDGSSDFFVFLNRYNIQLGTKAEIIEQFKYDQSMAISIEKQIVNMSANITSKILVKIL